MEKLLYLLLTILGLTIFSCTKHPETNISGKVVEYGTHAPIPNVKMSIIAGKSNGILVPDDEWWLDTIRTDANGRYSFGTDVEADYFYIGSAKKEGFYPLTSPEFYFYHGHKEYFELELDPYAWLEIEAINVDSIEGDAVSISGTYLKQYKPLEDYFIVIDEVKGNRNIYLYIKTDFINHISKKDTIYVSALDTVKYQILY